MNGYSIFAKYYDTLACATDFPTVAEYHILLMKKYGKDISNIVDLACGTGTLSCLYAEKGYHVTAVDLSEDMLCMAQAKADKTQIKNITFIKQDMRSFLLAQKTDAVISSFDSINHLGGINDLNSAFAAVSDSLADGGLFIFDVNTEYKHREILGENCFIFDMDKLYAVWQNSFSERTKRVKLTLDFFVNENDRYKRYTESFHETIFSEKKIEKSLLENGLTVIEKFDDFSFDMPHDESQRITYVTAKKVV